LKDDLLKFYAVQRQIFGICPHCLEFFRLSECKIFLRKKPVPDWLDKIDQKLITLDNIEAKLDEAEAELREKAREKGRRIALKTVRKIDPVFTPRKLNPDDAKVIFHPIDYIVFNGMNEAESIKNVVLLDRRAKQKDRRLIQRSIERVVERGNYEWRTLRVHEDGRISVE
jgi:predicted Holliday junction resolvase-like endonuclease